MNGVRCLARPLGASLRRNRLKVEFLRTARRSLYTILDSIPPARVPLIKER
jgi:hypothetical protein